MTSKATAILAGLAAVLAAVAVVIAATHAGPAGAAGTAGATGPVGATGPAGPAGKPGVAADTVKLQKDIDDLKAFRSTTEVCLKEFGDYVNDMSVDTRSDSDGSTYWLQSAWLNFGRQVDSNCQKFLFNLSTTGDGE
jgi:hypothetical protein